MRKFTLLFLILSSTISCRSAKQSNQDNVLYDFLVIREKYQNNWIDKEVNIFLLTDNHKLMDVYISGLEDNYVPCFLAGTFYSTDSIINKLSMKNIEFDDVSFFSDTDMPFAKQNQYEFLINEDIIKVFKVRLDGCVTNWETIGIKAKQPKDSLILPINITSFKLNNIDKIFIQQNIQKILNK